MGEEGFLMEESGEALAREISERFEREGGLDFSDRSRLVSFIEESGNVIDELEAEEGRKVEQQDRVLHEGTLKEAEINALAQGVADFLNVKSSATDEYGDGPKLHEVAVFLHDFGFRDITDARKMLLRMRAIARPGVSPLDAVWELVLRERYREQEGHR